MITFLKSWNKNYRDINHLPFYTMCEDKTSIAPGLPILSFKSWLWRLEKLKAKLTLILLVFVLDSTEKLETVDESGSNSRF